MTATQPESALRPDEIDLEVELIVEAIYRKYSYDFRHYARASLRRRLVDALAKLHVESLSMLQHLILRDATVFTALLTHMTVPVSDLFRDPDYFGAVRDHVLPMLATYPSIKIWVAGCSTGEEVYSFAILLEEAGLLARTLIYATDINPQALRAAEAGVYAVDRVPAFTRNYQRASGVRTLADYYTAAYGKVAFDRQLRTHVAFSDHCLATDAVFAEVQFISCRNVLIYFDSALQQRSLDLFEQSLAPRGFLGLGSHERLDPSRHGGRFEDVVPAERVYRRSDVMTEGGLELRERSPEVVAFGGSAGALEVLVELLATMPKAVPAAIVIVVHLPPDGDSRFAEVIASGSGLRAVEAEDKMLVCRSSVYVAPPDYHLLMERDGTLALAADEPVHFSRPSIDLLFESMANALGARACGILLSGASADGAAGLAAIRAKGGLTWVQSPETARVPLMPRQALALAPHRTVTVPEMSRMFAEWGNGG